jgi:hypothetical protein
MPADDDRDAEQAGSDTGLAAAAGQEQDGYPGG